MSLRALPAIAALLTVAWGAPALAQVSIAASPRRGVAGELRKVKLQLSGAASGPWHLVASEGSVSQVQQDGADTTATLTLPADKRPRIVQIIGWRDGSEELVATSLSLSGRATVPVQTEAGAQVTLVIGSDKAGPFQADAQGHVDAAVEVPPGAGTAQVVAVSAGARTVREVDLGVPPADRLFGAAIRGESTVRLVFVHAAGERAPKLDAIRLSGVSAVLKSDGPGRYVATLPIDAPFTAKAQVAGEPASVETVSFVPGPPVPTLHVTVGPTDLEVGEPARVSVELRPASAAEAVLRLDGHEVKRVTLDGGRAELSLDVLTATATVRVLEANVGDASARATVHVRAPAVRSLEIEPSKVEIAGTERVSVRVTGRSRSGSAVRLTEAPALEAANAKVVSAREDGEGWTLELAATAPPSSRVANLKAGGQWASLPVDVVKERPPRIFLITAEAGARGVLLGAPGPELGAGLGVPLWQWSAASLFGGGRLALRHGGATAGGVPQTVDELPLLATGTLVAQRAALRLTMNAGVGFELARLTSGGNSQSGPVGVFGFAAGLGFQAGPGDLFVLFDVRAALSNGGLGAGAKNLGGIGLFLGYQLLR